MQISRKDISHTKTNITIHTDSNDLQIIKNHVLKHLAKSTKLPGFRSGKAPLKVVEKHIDPTTLQTNFLDEAINTLYIKAVNQEKIRAVNNPKVTLKKFVPFTELQFDAEVEIIGKITLTDYKKIKAKRDKVSVTTKEVNEVIKSLQQRSAERKAVTRNVQKDDEVIIDFSGKDRKGNAINGADGKDYPLIIGSNTFIPGFEDNIIGMKNGEEKSFTLTFPKDYGVSALANKKVTFSISVKKVNELKEPSINDEFAAKVGPFKNVDELKADVKKQLMSDKQARSERMFENEVIKKIVDKSSVDLPESLIEEQVERLKSEVKQNLLYRGQTWQEMLKQESLSEEDYVYQRLRPEAEHRVKTGLILSEISLIEGIDISPEELEVQMQILKSQYTDPAMQTELNKPEARRDIASRMLTEKTVKRLKEIADQ